MKKEIVDKLLSSKNPDDAALGIEYLLRLGMEDIKSLITTESTGNNKEIGEYKYWSRDLSATYEEDNYVVKGKYKILIRHKSVMWCTIPVKELKRWGWTKK